MSASQICCGLPKALRPERRTASAPNGALVLSIQALNNWGLVLQELAAFRPVAERDAIMAASILKFRQAIRLRPEFDRACYNLGTVLYSHAIALKVCFPPFTSPYRC